jgi:hypothetical protein
MDDVRLYREVTGLKELNLGVREVLPKCVCSRSFPGQLHLAGRSFFWTVNPSFPSTLTAPAFPPSKSPEPSR